MQPLLKDKRALITGSTAGIGKGIAMKFAEHGAFVIVVGQNRERGESVVQEIFQQTGQQNAAFYAMDVSSTSSVKEVMEEIQKQHGFIEILVNNAGVTRDQLLLKMSEEDWDEVMTTNVKSCYNTSQALIRAMIRARKGKIINMSSVVGLTGNAGQVNYSASKAAVIGFTKSLAREVAARNICVNCIAPGFIDTKMTDALSELQKKNTLSRIPFERMGTPEDVANAALFLASDLSAYITGQVITVDGGMTI